MHAILKNAGNESPAFVDVDGDGRPDILCNDPVAKQMIWMRSPAKGDTLWTRYVIGQGEYTRCKPIYAWTWFLGHEWRWPTRCYHHQRLVGMSARSQTENWVFHPADLGEDCSQIYILDAKGNGQKGLVSASAHNYGIWWHEKTGETSYTHHTIFNGFSESHALTMADVNGDGHPDLVTGKRYFAHNGEDPGAYEPAVLYWFEFKPGENPSWIPHLIDSDSGVGLQVLVQDINGDGLPDIIVANKKGVFFFEQKK